MFHNIDIMESYQRTLPAGTLPTPITGLSPRVLILFGLCCVSSAIAQAQQPEFDTNPQLPANAVRRISEHVYAISGFPNIGMVIGNRASLVIDTGLGPRNGALIAKEVQKIAKTPKLYLATTHFHPEHASGEAGFPAGTILIRSKIQQQELEQDHGGSLALFARNPDYAPYLQGVSFRRPDISFDREYRLDLGGVHVRLMWLGPAHTRGDQEFFVEEDRALFTGDLAMSSIRPRNYAQGSSWEMWITILDELAALRPVYILPDHGAFGDATLIDEQRSFLSRLPTVGCGANQR
jgi:glyoxylase-like metal-dependent hydrolase (beta-lactamase superfamily II)